MKKWGNLADEKTVNKTVSELKSNGIETFVVENGKEAKEKVLSLLPKGAEVMTMSSTTLDAIGVSQEIDSGKFNSVRKNLMSMDRKTQGREMQKLGSSPEWAVGSVHAITEDGKVLIASNSGSQLPAYAYGAGNVIWVVGTQKIVKNLDEGIKRIYEHSLKLESERVKKAYGMPSSFISKILIVNRETVLERIVIILVKEQLGF